MKLSLAALASTLLSTSLALSTRQEDPRPINTTFKIASFTLNKSTLSNTINSLSFRILATNGGTLDFECKQYDASLGRVTTEGFRSDYVYSCGELSFFTWNFVPETSVLSLWQQVSDEVFLGGEVVVRADDVAGEYLIDMRSLSH